MWRLLCVCNHGKAIIFWFWLKKIATNVFTGRICKKVDWVSFLTCQLLMLWVGEKIIIAYTLAITIIIGCSSSQMNVCFFDCWSDNATHVKENYFLRVYRSNDVRSGPCNCNITVKGLNISNFCYFSGWAWKHKY